MPAKRLGWSAHPESYVLPLVSGYPVLSPTTLSCTWLRNSKCQCIVFPTEVSQRDARLHIWRPTWAQSYAGPHTLLIIVKGVQKGTTQTRTVCLDDNKSSFPACKDYKCSTHGLQRKHLDQCLSKKRMKGPFIGCKWCATVDRLIYCKHNTVLENCCLVRQPTGMNMNYLYSTLLDIGEHRIQRTPALLMSIDIGTNSLEEVAKAAVSGT